MRVWLLLAGLGLSAFLYLLFWWQSVPSVPRFDGQRAFADLQKQVSFGPRIPNTAGHAACLKFLVESLRDTADRVTEEPVLWKSRKDSTQVWHGTNVIASFNPDASDRILLLAHWDTRPFADQDPDSSLRQKPVLGANDAASGVAVLLELARQFKAYPPKMGIDLLLTDMEDLGDYNSVQNPKTNNPFSIGAAQFVAAHPTYHPRFGVLLDMIGDKNLEIPYEQYSYSNARSVVDLVWAAAKRAKAAAFVDRVGDPLMDDHLPFLKQGIPVIDLIDFNYPYWHTTQDTPDKCSPESLQQVGQTLLELIYRPSV